VSNPTAAFAAGLDAIKPAATRSLARAVQRGFLPVSLLDKATGHVLEEMFRFGLVAHPLHGHTDTPVDTPAHAADALEAAEESMVLLKDAGGVLPLQGPELHSVTVIGDDASLHPVSAGHGSADVVAPFVVTPLAGLRAALGPGAVISYSPGSSANDGLPAIPARELNGAALPGTGSGARRLRPGPHHWAATLVVPRTGLYTFSLSCNGDATLYLDGRPLLHDAGLHAYDTWSVSVPLRARKHIRLRLRWVETAKPPRLGLADVTPSIEAAAAAARRADVALVFAADYNSEGVDRPTLGLPGDEDALIEAVAAANPRTVVVLDTGGPVLMPWLSKVASVLEAWYPGEQDGAAIAAVLTGATDPAGRLPVTFPASDAQGASAAAPSWPGVGSAVYFGDNGIGYRFDETEQLRPLFPFGFGLSYTTFALSSPRLAAVPGGYRLTLEVADTGRRAGSDVVQVYVGMPADAGEAPHQLAAFARVSLQAHSAASVSLEVPDTALRTWVDRRWVSDSGVYAFYAGQSSQDLPIRLEAYRP
jgi:beta-glucosidase